MARLLGYGAVALGASVFSLLLLQVLLGRRLEQARIAQLGSEVASTLILGEVALERFSPEALSAITGMRLAVGPRPEPDRLPPPGGRSPEGLPPRLGLPPLVPPPIRPGREEPPWFARPAMAPPAPAFRAPAMEARLARQAAGLRDELCERLSRCPVVWPARSAPRGVWVEMGSPLETVWLFTPLPSLRGWPPDPLVLSMALAAGGLTAVLVFLSLEVQRPLARLEEALADVGLEVLPRAVPARGSTSVRRLTTRFNAMLERLDRAGRERTTMLAGIAHDLRSPLTRLKLRLSLAATAPIEGPELAGAEADLGALERITRQFLLFAGADGQEVPVLLPLDELLAEAAAVVGEVPLEMELQPLWRRVRPTLLSRAVANLLDNALRHGRPPLRLVLRAPEGEVGESGFEIQVWDSGPGISAEDWERALLPFHRLDHARGGQGHCGLGLAIVERVAREHGGGLRRLGAGDAAADASAGGAGAAGFGVALWGRSLPGG